MTKNVCNLSYGGIDNSWRRLDLVFVDINILYCFGTLKVIIDFCKEAMYFNVNLNCLFIASVKNLLIISEIFVFFEDHFFSKMAEY